jgi:hypothetical protein
MTRRHADLPYAVGNPRVQLSTGIFVYEPDAAAVGSNEVASHVCIEAEKNIRLLLLSYPRGIVEDHSQNSLTGTRGFQRICHSSGRRRDACGNAEDFGNPEATD